MTSDDKKCHLMSSNDKHYFFHFLTSDPKNSFTKCFAISLRVP
jgi:hypothetical protein